MLKSDIQETISDYEKAKAKHYELNTDAGDKK